MAENGIGWAALGSLAGNGPAARGPAPGTLRRILRYAHPYRGGLLALCLLVLAGSAAIVATPLLLQAIVEVGIARRDTDTVVLLAGLAAAVAVGEGLLSYAQRMVSARIGESIIYDLRTELVRHIQRMSLTFFTQVHTGALVSRLNTDVIGAQRALTSTLAGLLANVVAVVSVVATMFVVSWPVAVIAVLLLPAFFLIGRVAARGLRSVARAQMGVNADLAATAVERFSAAGAMLVMLYGRDDDEAGAFARHAGRARDLGIVSVRRGQLLMVTLTGAAAIATAAVYGVGGALVAGGAMQLGALIALVALIGRLYGPVAGLVNVHVDVMNAMVSFERVFAVLDLKPPVLDSGRRGPIEPAVPPRVSFDQVSFAYPTTDQLTAAGLDEVRLPGRRGGTGVLHGVSFELRPGTVTALVGPSGAGKTTIGHLLARLYDPDSGAVRINDVDLREYRLGAVREAVGVVSQETFLFHDTIRANLHYARPDAAEADLERALEAAQLLEFVRGLPLGLDTVVGDRGQRLSGGERQRLALARLFLKSPAIVVLDEATAHLDGVSERLVQEALREILRGRTALVMAHRLSTIRSADAIVVLADGLIVEEGGHEALLARQGLYASLYLSPGG
ncbi:ATP-binding cassette, subfamily B [Micromonospora haikouensis]|uniref:ATP-binding cassette, subfamily B n=1 Tax=Micromonospora haikouensis TaxID=686309 RepID=A0A1C4XGP6_9ACTN|nr:ABC transporter ATP-binding protein [Micromonospora haikouensis]SCF07605.1 ATP-binding cassette, subfamily B [Micromonospora haikouensis]